MLYVSLDLRDDGARRERERRVGPAVLDERIAHEAVEELEEWKERQEEHFKAQVTSLCLRSQLKFVMPALSNRPF